MNKRPAGVTVIALYLIISGLIGIIAGIALIAYPEEILDLIRQDSVMKEIIKDITASGLLIFGIAILMTSAISLMLAWGIWKLISWARIGVIVMSLIEILSAFLTPSLFSIFQVIIPALIVIYLLRSDAAKAFRRQPEQPTQPDEVQIKCPGCGMEFKATRGEDKTFIKCPNCGKEGLLY